ncbi:hypothetical protein [Krasilnikovia sp. MM14-A1004]|uniref:hypothetical protein n=1 Tax=Krasilnikovia sp. MM14-A1004 TaxID=3373541 RepID=UPI00399C7176
MRRKKPMSWGPAESESALPGITTVPWTELRGASGRPAGELPAQLVALVLDPGDELRVMLSGELAPSGLWAQATPYAIPFLIHVAADVNHPRGADIAQLLLEEIAHGEPHRSELDLGNTDLRAQVRSALEAGRPFFESQVRTGDPASQAQSIAILAGLDGGSGRLRELLASIDVQRADPLVAEAIRDAHDRFDGD